MAELNGIDVSSAQGVIDWAKVKASGEVDFVIIRTSYGWSTLPDAQTDKFFRANVAGCEEQGIPYGLYHYSYCIRPENARREAQYFLNTIKDTHPTFPVFMDIEDPSQQKLDRSTLTQIAYDFCDEVEKAGYYVGIYSYKNFLENNLDMSALSRFDVWVAQLSAVNTYNGSYGMWQHSWSGSVSGINGSVDLNTAYRNYPAIIKNSGKDISAASRDIDISLRITTSPIAQDGSTAIQKYQFGDTTLYVSVKAAESTL